MPNQVKAAEQYFPVMQFIMLYKVVLIFQSVRVKSIRLKATLKQGKYTEDFFDTVYVLRMERMFFFLGLNKKLSFFSPRYNSAPT